MPIVATDLKWYLSTKSGSAGFSIAQGDPNLSLGKYISTTEVSGSLDGLFDQITYARNAASEVDYRCVFVANNHATITLVGAKVWLDGGDPAGGMGWAIALDTTAASAKTASAAQALEAATDTAPGSSITGLTYSVPTTAAGGLSVGDLAPGQCRAIWVQCSATNSAAVTETVKLTVTGETIA